MGYGIGARKNLQSRTPTPVLTANRSWRTSSGLRDKPGDEISFSPSKPVFSKSVLTGLFAGGLLSSALAAPPAPDLTSCLPVAGDIYQSSDGVADLAWEAAGAATFELEESGASQDFSPRYQGPDPASIRSGLAAGVHRFRVRGIDSEGEAGPWSEDLAVEVTYMEAGRLRLLLILGGTVVLATIGTILHGHFSHKKREAA